MPQNTAPPTVTSRPRAGASLEHRLPAMISALLLLVIVTFGSVAYREVQRSSIVAARERLGRVTRQLADLSGVSTARRATALRALAAEPPIVAALLGGPDSAAAAALQRATTRADSTLVTWTLRTRTGAPRLTLGAALAPRDSTALLGVIRERSTMDSVRYSAPYASDGGVAIWSVVPVRARGALLGYLAERRRLNNSPRAEQDIRGLVGQDVSVWLASLGTGFWVNLAGQAVAPPFVGAPRGAVFTTVAAAGGARLIAAQAEVRGTPWSVVLALPEAAVLERPLTFLRRMLWFGLVLLLAGAAGAWLLSRHVTRPLRRLTDAADAVAAGDYGGQVAIARGDELGRLARAFNAMAAQIGASHAELARRLQQSALLARELAERNEALQTERHRADEARQAAQDANAAKSSFLAMMSHELRTPLNAIGGYAELLALGIRGPVTDSQREDLARIRRNQQHLQTIINDMLNLSRIEAGQLAITMADVPVREVVDEVEALIAPQVAAAGVRYVVAGCDPALTVRADRDRLQQVLLNLVSNAVRFTERGGTVTVGCTAGPAEVFLSVSDTGIGIPPDRHEAIFEPFVQVDHGLTRRTGGTGLGLAISRELTSAMGGQITVESEPGRGSVFTVTLERAGRGARTAAAL